ncbi:MAG TPA: fatty acid desaturase family protein [Planctomycetaceae bacterium]|jgi:fatty acid desaturase
MSAFPPPPAPPPWLGPDKIRPNQAKLSVPVDGRESDEYAGTPHEKLAPAIVREFSEISTGRFVVRLLLEWTYIIAAVWLCQRYWHPALYVAAVAWIGARQHALAILMHDAAHYRAAGNRRLNDFLGVLASAPLFISLHAYRLEHFAHHRHVNTDDDPQWVDRDTPEWKFPKSRKQLVWLLAGDLLGLGSIETVRYILRMQWRLWSHGAGVVLTALQPVLTIAIVTAVIATGNLLPFALYWVIPIATWLTMVLRIRSIAEHFALPRDHVLTETRTVIPTKFERLLIAPMNIAYHLEHHQYPSVPFHRLKKLHKLLMKMEAFREKAHLTRGYFRVFQECLPDPDNPVAPAR